MLCATIKEDPVLLFLLLLLFATSDITIIIITATGIALVINVHISHLLKTAASISELAGIIIVVFTKILEKYCNFRAL